MTHMPAGPAATLISRISRPRAENVSSTAAPSHSPASSNIALHPMHRLALDVVGPLRPQAPGGHDHILVTVDSFSRYTWLRPLARPSASRIIAILKDIFFNSGMPSKLVTDQRSCVHKQRVQGFCRRIRHHSSPHYGEPPCQQRGRLKSSSDYLKRTPRSVASHHSAHSS